MLGTLHRSWFPRAVLALLLVLGAPGLAVSGAAAEPGGPAAASPAAAPVLRSGILKVWTKLQSGSGIPNGTTVSISVFVTVIDASYSNTAQYFGSATIWGGKTNLMVTMPYLWTLTSAGDSVSITVSASTSSAYSFLSKTITVPANGATTLVTLEAGI
jgi:hypothetical protein